jgi:hypothetical protein
MAGDRDLAGVGLTDATVHGFQNREHRGDAGRKANSPRNKIRPRGHPRGVPAMAGGGELTEARNWVLQSPILQREATGRMRRGWGSRPRHKCGRGKPEGHPPWMAVGKHVGARGHGPRGHHSRR